MDTNRHEWEAVIAFGEGADISGGKSALVLAMKVPPSEIGIRHSDDPCNPCNPWFSLAHYIRCPFVAKRKACSRKLTQLQRELRLRQIGHGDRTVILEPLIEVTVAPLLGLKHHSAMIRPVKVDPLNGFRLRVRYADGVEGIIDLCDQVGHGVFAPLRDETFFHRVHIGDHGQIAWSDDLELCPDSAYLEIMGKIGAPAKNA